jgi:hypothetical protein
MGASGSQYINQGEEVFQAAFQHGQHAIQDTTGAGDAFDAGFLFARLNSLAVPDSLALGNLCAFRSITSSHGIADVCLDNDYLHTLGNLLMDCSVNAHPYESLMFFLNKKKANQLKKDSITIGENLDH